MSPIPAQPINLDLSNSVEPAKKNMYILHYRKGDNPHPMTKFFFIEGDIQKAMARARSHCDTMNYRFLRVDSFVSNLEADEQKHLG